MSHTKEPWAVDLERNLRIEDQHGRSIASCGCSDLLRDDWEANTRRIVACVNACQGIPTSMLELSGALPEPPVSHYLQHVMQQRDELLAALKLLVCTADITDDELENALESVDKDVREQANAFLVARSTVAKVEAANA